MSCLSSKQSVHSTLRDSLREDFDYLRSNHLPDLYHIFHLLIRRKALLRLCPELDAPRAPDEFEEVEDARDQFEFYKANFWSLRFLHRTVDQELFPAAAAQLRRQRLEGVERKHAQSPGFAFELELLMEEFRLLVEALADHYQRAQLYHLIEPANVREFAKVDIDQKLRSVLMPLMVSKLAGRFGSVSSSLARKLVVLLLSRATAVNIGCAELLLPDLCLFGENSRAVGYLSQFLSARVFTREKEQLRFFLMLINARVAELLAELAGCFRQLLDAPQPLGAAEFETRHEELNYKFEEINAMKLHCGAEQLDFGTLCRLVPAEQRKAGEEDSAETEPTRKFSSDQEYSAGSEQELRDYFARPAVSGREDSP